MSCSPFGASHCRSRAQYGRDLSHQYATHLGKSSVVPVKLSLVSSTDMWRFDLELLASKSGTTEVEVKHGRRVDWKDVLKRKG